MLSKTKTMEPSTVTLQIVGMHCTSCAINIDFELEDLEGVKESKTHYVRQVSKVIFFPDKVSHEQLITVITKLGYEVVILDQEPQEK